MNDKVKQMCICAMMVAVMAILAQIKIDLPGLVPLTMQTLGLYLIGLLLVPKYAFIASLVYVLMGAIGIPVFAGFTGGIGILAGPTGGYIYSFPIIAIVISYLLSKKNTGLYKCLSLCVGTIVCYSIGTGWFMFVTDSSLWASLTWCVFPFLIGDSIKIVLAIVVSNKIENIRQ